jgi:prolyl-tRNA editing enzyme YbaK/EbsC (Cys-tRNA(Pro) deacylase)
MDPEFSSYHERLQAYIEEAGVAAEHLVFDRSCHTVEEAAEAARAEPEDFVKSMCLVRPDGGMIVAVIKGEDRVSTSRVGKALGGRPPRIASPEEILDRTGYPCGGTPPFGFEAVFVMDPRVLEKDAVLAGGGSPVALMRITPREILRVNGASVARVRR